MLRVGCEYLAMIYIMKRIFLYRDFFGAGKEWGLPGTGSLAGGVLLSRYEHYRGVIAR